MRPELTGVGLVCAVTTMESLGLTQFDVIDSAHSGGELLGYAAEGMLRTNAERVGEAVEEQHTMETAAAALGRRLALAELAEKSEGGMAMPPNPRLRGRGRGGAGSRGGRAGGGRALAR